MESMRKLSARATSVSRGRLPRSESRIRPMRRAAARGRSAITPVPIESPRVAWERGPNTYFAELIELEHPKAEEPAVPPPTPERQVIRHATESRLAMTISAAPPARTRASLSPGERSDIMLPEERKLELFRWVSAFAALGAIWALIS